MTTTAPTSTRAEGRWLVERTPDSFDTVHAATLEVGTSGALVFRDEDERTALLLAPGQWISVVPDEDPR